MKTLFLILFLTFYGILAGQSTELSNTKLQLGVSLGATLSNISFDKNFFGPNSESPRSEYRVGYGISADINYMLGDNFYMPASFAYLNRRFAVETGGPVLVVDNQGNLIFVQTDYYEFKVDQLSGKIGLGYQILPALNIEVQPYFQYNISDNMLKISKDFDWQKAEFYQTTSDYGVSGALKFSIDKFYLKGSYDYGLKKQEEFAFADANGLSIGKATVRNSMFTLFMGYRFM